MKLPLHVYDPVKPYDVPMNVLYIFEALRKKVASAESNCLFAPNPVESTLIERLKVLSSLLKTVLLQK